MIINKIGTYHGAPYRYINLLKENSEIKLRWLHLSDDKMVEELKEEVARLGIPNIDFYQISQNRSKAIRQIQRLCLVLQRIGYLQNKRGEFLIRGLLKLLSLDRITREFFENNDNFNWSGHNDVDNSLVLTAWIKIKIPHLKITYSYKEHRCKYRLDESLALTLADKLIIPTNSSVEILSEIYNSEFSSKTLLGDEDWRSQSITNFIKESNNSQKLSLNDKVPHVIFLTRYAEYGESVERRGSRINFLNIIEVFAINKVKVHLKAMCICENVGKECRTKKTPYHELSEKYPDYVNIEDPIKLNINEDYLELSKFDFGIIHNYNEGEETSVFSKINIPNRVFEYMAANVQPIVLRNTLNEVERIIETEGYGVIVDTYHEACIEMHRRINMKEKDKTIFSFSKSFETFFETLKSSFLI
jgi:hypothetical protein